MVDEITIMVTAVILAVGVMMFSARPISLFVTERAMGIEPTSETWVVKKSSCVILCINLDPLQPKHGDFSDAI